MFIQAGGPGLRSVCQCVRRSVAVAAKVIRRPAASARTTAPSSIAKLNLNTFFCVPHAAPAAMQRAMSAKAYQEHVEDVLKIVTGLALSGYGAAVVQMTGMARAFRADVPLWAVHKAHKGPRGRTRLMYAARKGDVERARFLLERGAAIDDLNKYGDPALVYACQKGHLDVVRFLVERGGAAVNAARTTVGTTALMMPALVAILRLHASWWSAGARQ
jgi:hypothetical protein